LTWCSGSFHGGKKSLGIFGETGATIR
jgi:hypothetical protein